MISALCFLIVGLPGFGHQGTVPNSYPGGSEPKRVSQKTAEPFTYLLYPSDVVGFKDCPQAFQLTYDGAMNNGFGEFQLLAGKDPTPIDVRSKTLAGGSLPFPQYDFERDRIHFHVQFFGAPKGLDPRENLVAYVLITASNRTPEAKETKLVAQFVNRSSRWRAEMPCREWYRDRFMDQSKWSSTSTGTDRGGIVTKSGHLVFAYSGTPAPSHLTAPGVEYSLHLEPKQTAEVTFRVPFVPVDLNRANQLAAVTDKEFHAAVAQVATYWILRSDEGTQIDLPEQKVTDTVKASLAYILIARDVLEDGKNFMPTVNKFQYHTFYFRDGAFTARACDMMNLPQVARECVQYYFETNPDGSARDVKRGGEDDWGESLWAIGAHFRATNDLQFAKYAYPALAPHMANFQASIAADPLKLWPKLGPYDAELLTGHYTSHSFWVLMGLREAINIAHATGHDREASLWQTWHDGYRKRFMAQLGKVTALSGGYIPPGIDKPEDGRDWENATAGVYPFGVIDKSDPRVAATLRTIREYKWREGISTWGTNAWVIKMRMRQGVEEDPGTLHNYQMYNLTQTALACGMQREVLEDLYSALAHTSATHAGFEMGTRPWGERDVSGNFTPHGWFAARTVELVRNMLVREEGDAMHLASCLSPQWIGAGQEVRLTNAPTDFGMVSYKIRSRKEGADLELSTKWRRTPKSLYFHIPYFVELDSAVADGKRVVAKGDQLPISPNTKHLTLNWHWIEHPDLSYARAVELWKLKDKDRRPTVDRYFLFPHPTMPKVDLDARAFVAPTQVSLLNTSGSGDIRFTLDGSDPKRTSPLYMGPVAITKTRTIKAACFWPDGRSSDPVWVNVEIGFANIPMVPGSVSPGLVCDLYVGKFDRLPAFDALTPTRTMALTTFGLDEANPKEEFYAMRQSAVIDIPRDGVYRFWTGSDDGSRLWIGKRLVVDSDRLHAYVEVHGDIPLRKGRYPITVGYFEAGGGHILKAFWAGPGFEKQAIPATSLGH
jgi:hypothetical protein